MPKQYLFFITLALFFSAPALAETERSFASQTYLNQGKPDQAIETAHMLLEDPRLREEERKDLLELITKAEIMKTRAKHYEDVSAAVESIETLIKEFPSTKSEPAYQWQIIELYWNQNSLEQAQANILDLQNRFPLSSESQESGLLLGKIYFMGQNYGAARNAFLRYAITFPTDSTQGRTVRLWTALVDYEEKRFSAAYKVFQEVFSAQPALITQQDSIYSRYINILDIQGEHKEALKQSSLFLAEYKTSTHSAEIRLLHADLKSNLPNRDVPEILKAYKILASSEANTIIGRQAFMRKMMLQMDAKKSYNDIKPAIIALKRIANQNQMSEVEDEAFLHEGILWEKVITTDFENAPKGAAKAALEQFSQASKAINPRIKNKAKAHGEKTFIQHIKTLIAQKEWLSVVSLWEQFSNFRPSLNDSTLLRYDVARGLRLLMEYEQAETILSQLHSQSGDSVWGEKVMLERARLWLDRHDQQGVSKIMQWLDKHEYTLYRPEMLVIVAQMHLQAKNTIVALHTLDLIQPADISPDAKAEFWQTKALATEMLSRWHIAAHAWRMYAKQNVDDVEQAYLNEAHALFKGDDFQKAEQLYSKTSKALQTPIWEYRYSICQLKSGKWNQAIERLTILKDNPNAGIYASMAALTLAEREADRLLENSL